jgi:centromeric protein E
MEVLLKEKDDEIAELRARLDDKERMVAALRSAARKRDVAEIGGRRSQSIDEGAGRRRRKASASGSEEAEDVTF